MRARCDGDFLTARTLNVCVVEIVFGWCARASALVRTFNPNWAIKTIYLIWCLCNLFNITFACLIFFINTCIH